MKQRGFTLMELVITLIVVAILAVIAFPRLTSLRPEAELAQAKAVAASFQQAVAFAHTRWQIVSPGKEIVNLPGYVDGVLDLNAAGYPLGINKNNPMGQAQQIGKGDAGCVSLWQTLIVDAPSVALPSNDPDFNADYHAYRHNENGDNNPMSRCSYVYRAGGDRADRDSAAIVIEYRSEDGSVGVIQR
ncbi:type II secretion system protein [Ferrimonas kyonanensis]|uniref:type II secretion system protein n=1 Tax=Ferrimonas kyonanensis TaxID=364763 RepID=UPI0003F6C66E|nr:prepilin-type N-terminal cleavage/methylation domain-containing protein [Ferrimonas kyonanensis]